MATRDLHPASMAGPDSTPAGSGTGRSVPVPLPRSGRRLRRAAVPARWLLALALVVGLIAPAAALADGDPASDVLAVQSLFLPQDSGASPSQVAQLSALVAEAARAGFPVRVALVASPADLGSVTALWRRPVSYARFLGLELGLVYRGPLVVLMPDGVGVYDARRPGQALGAARQPPGRNLAPAAIATIRDLARAAGHPLALPAATAPPGAASSGLSPLEWIVIAAGLVVIAAAWTASLRARPLRAGPAQPPRA